MMIFNVPVGAKATHKAAMGWLVDTVNLRGSQASPFHAIIFSYEPDFNYVALALRSLMSNVNNIKTVNLFVDQKAPFSGEQIQTLTQICPQLVPRPVDNFSWASPESTVAQFQCYYQVAQQADDGDFIMQFDSDILFMKSDKLHRIACSNLDIIADGHWDDYKFIQGGLWAIRSKVIKECFANINLDTITGLMEQTGGHASEDRCLSQHLVNCGKKIYYTHLMLFPSEYQRINTPNKFVRWDFCALHFIRDKDRMKEHFSKFCE